MIRFICFDYGLAASLGRCCFQNKLRPGAGADARRSLGLAVVGGGLIVCPMLTLYITPVIYIYLDRWAHWLDHGASQRASGSVGLPALGAAP
ncbi:MAG: hypothetical protein RL598_2030 [Verrucomicrobiota bacterium]|jgi:hypothetical protein